MKDLGDYLDELFNPELKKMNDLLSDIRRQTKINEMIESLRDELMEVKDMKSLDELIFKYIELLQNEPKLFKHVNNAKRRINGIKKMEYISWKNQLN